MKLATRSALSSGRHHLGRRGAALLAATGLTASIVLFQGSGDAATAGGVHIGSIGGPVTVTIHVPHPHPHPECWICVD